MIIDLLMIAAVVMMIFESGWWDSMDEMINRRWRFHHLPHVFRCQFCQCFWLSLGYLLIIQESLIFSLFVALVNANIGELMLPLFKLIKESMKAGIEWLISKIY